MIIIIAMIWFLRRPSAIGDVAILNAMIYDGSGAAPFEGGIAIRGNRITAVWRGWRLPWRVAAKRKIDARGLAVAPGFVDTHSHADLGIADASSSIRAENFVMQGVTTMVVGNCGRSPRDLRKFRAIVESRGSNVNIAALAGLNTIREAVMRHSANSPTPAELAAMSKLLERQIAAGAVGVSTGLEYVPGRFATRDEMFRLLRLAARRGGVHTSHMRNEAKHVVASAREVLSLSEQARIPLLISHLKVSGPRNCALVDPLLDLFARRRAHPLYVDQYPYAAASTTLDVYLPDWFFRLGPRERRNALRTRREELKRELRRRLAEDGYVDFRFARVVDVAEHRSWAGLTIGAIDRARHGGVTSPETQLDLVLDLAGRGSPQMIYHNICPDAVERIQRTLSPMIGSDSAIRWDNGRSAPHPRGWGAFAKFLGYSVRERKVTGLSEAIRRMTDLPARFFGLTGRGRIAAGYYADIVMFDPKIVAARASYQHPFRKPIGIEYVFVN
ncbi:MAG TPA: amidohydrolase family protein, partial [Thermoanaerobaculia bacterium]